jgi:hypothetical protein
VSTKNFRRFCYNIEATMKSHFFKNLLPAAALFMIVALFGFFPATVLTMQHSAQTVQHEMAGMVHDMEIPAAACIDFHLGIIEDMTQSTPQVTASVLAFLLLILLLTAPSFSLRHELQNLFNTIRDRFRRLRYISLSAYILQLGSWLAIAFKKSPAYAFATA